jgi:aspartate 1-decarboxylase
MPSVANVKKRQRQHAALFLPLAIGYYYSLCGIHSLAKGNFMLRIMLKSKIHRATITAAELDYIGSLSLDPVLMKGADLVSNEKVLVANLRNGERFETYVISGKPGEVCLNGAAARLGRKGDKVIIMAFALVDDRQARRMKPRVVHVDARNRPR